MKLYMWSMICPIYFKRNNSMSRQMTSCYEDGGMCRDSWCWSNCLIWVKFIIGSNSLFIICTNDGVKHVVHETYVNDINSGLTAKQFKYFIAGLRHFRFGCVWTLNWISPFLCLSFYFLFFWGILFHVCNGRIWCQENVVFAKLKNRDSELTFANYWYAYKVLTWRYCISKLIKRDVGGAVG